MARNILLFFLITTALSAAGQIISDKTHYDFGDIHKEDDKYVDFQVTNVSNQVVKVVKFETPYGISIRFSKKELNPDESIYLRIKYTPRRKGTFQADVPVWFSSNSEPFVFSVSGKALSFNLDESMDVPDFKPVVSKEIGETSKLNILVVRKSDDSPVEDARIDIIWDGVLYKTTQTNASGRVNTELVTDNYYIVAGAKNLGIYEASISVNQQSRELKIELGPEGSLISVDEDSTVITEAEPEPEPEPIQEQKDSVAVIETPAEPVAPPDENPDFSNLDFVPNNIVFLIDVSISMKQQGRMELLKASMIELTNLLRSNDKVAIVTYSARAEIALKSTSASNKSEIIDVIKSLEPKGSTSGERGIKKAYQVLESNKIDGGNNQIFISTDGAFNLDKQDKDLIEMVRKNANKGYKISVIGIRNSLGTVKNMKKIAEEGNGNYLHISNYSTARRTLVEEVKLQSRNHQ